MSCRCRAVVLARAAADEGVWQMCGRGRAGVRQERTAQYGGRMFVFAATLGVQGDRACAMRPRLGENRNFMYAPCLVERPFLLRRWLVQLNRCTAPVETRVRIGAIRPGEVGATHVFLREPANRSL